MILGICRRVWGGASLRIIGFAVRTGLLSVALLLSWRLPAVPAAGALGGALGGASGLPGAGAGAVPSIPSMPSLPTTPGLPGLPQGVPRRGCYPRTPRRRIGTRRGQARP